MLKQLIALLLTATVAAAQPFPARPGPVIISQPGTGGSSSSGGVDTNAVIALIEQYATGGGVVSNTVVQLTVDTWYTNGEYPLVVEAQVELNNSSALMLFSVKDTNSAVIGYLPGSAAWNEFGNASKYAFATTTATEDNVQSLGGYVPAYAAFRYYASGTTASIYDNSPNGTRLVYFGSGGGTNSSSGGVSAAQVAAIMATNGSSIRFNVKAFGAKGDGNTLDELAVQAAIDAASTNGGTVWIPNGTYRIGTNNPLTSYTVESYPCFLTLRSNNVVLEGESHEGAILVAGTNAPASWNFIGSQRVTNCAIKNLTLDAASFQNVVDMTQIYYPDNFLFENVIFKNMKDGDACDVQYGNVVKVSGCEFYNIGGNCVSSQERLIIVENCRGLGTGFSVSENRSVDGATSPTSVIQNYASKMVVSDSTFENCSIGLDLGLGAVVMNNVDFVFTNTTAITNMWVAGGTLELNNCHLLSSSAFSAGHLIAVNTNRALTIRGGSFDGKRQIFANQPTYSGIAIRGATFGKVIVNNSHAITLNSADGAIIENCDFYGNGYRGVNLDSGLLASDNVKISGGYMSGMSPYCEASGSTNMFITDVVVVNGSAPIGLWAGTGHTVKNCFMSYAGAAINVPTRVENNTFSSLSFSAGYSQGGEFVNNVIYGGISGTAAQINNCSWRDNYDSAYKPLRNYTITTNYTADSIDAVLIFNGSNLTNTIPSAVTLNRGNEFIIKNLNATALEITNSTGAQTFDGALRLSLPQYGAVRLRSNGANWSIISTQP